MTLRRAPPWECVAAWLITTRNASSGCVAAYMALSRPMFPAYQSRSVIGVRRIAFVHVHPSDSNDLSPGVDLIRSGDSFIDLKFLEIVHLKVTSCSDEFGYQLGIAYIVPGGLIAALVG